MSIDLTVWAADEAAITAELSATMLFQDGQSVVGMLDDRSFGHELVMDGFQGSSDVTWRGLISRFASAPSLNWTCTHVESGQRYRVESRTVGPDNLTYILNLVNLTK